LSTQRRVIQVAKEFNLSTQALLSFLAKQGYEAKTPMSPISEEMYEEIRKRYVKEPAAASPDLDFRRKLREKKLAEEEKKKQAQRELQERIRTATRIMAEKPLGRRKVTQKEAVAVAPAVVSTEVSPATPAVVPPPVVEKVEPAIEVEVPPPVKVETPAPSLVEMISRAREEQERREREEKRAAVPAKPEQTKAAEEAPKKKKKRRKRKKKEVEPELEALEKERERAQAKKKAKKKKRKVSEEEIQQTIRHTFAVMEEAGRPKRHRRRIKETDEEAPEAERNVISVTEFISVGELANLMGAEPSEVIKKCLGLGMLVTINQRLDLDTIRLVADEFGFEVESLPEYGEDIIERIEEQDDPSKMQPRPPVVTIMGHVDHGKTTLLDYIRKTNVVAGEAGGITQHIGAYEVNLDGKAITFLDTPGHEAFTAMRARGAQATDIVVLVVAADDAVMPQTIEAIDHAKAAGVPIIVSINKIDKPNANPELIKKQLAEHGVLIEEWGGKYQCVEISAKQGRNVEKLLERILLEAEVLELKANPHRPAKGVIIESRLDKGKGPVATVLVQAGTLNVGDAFIAGQYAGKVRAMYNERGQRVDLAPPSTPVQVVGFEGVCEAGDTFYVLPSEKAAKQIALKRQQLHREQDYRAVRHVSLDEISRRIKEGEVKELPVIVKGDVAGSVEALGDALMRLSTEEVAVRVIHKGVGAISESDVLLASASNAVILGFQVRPTLQARELAARNHVDIRLYEVIYDAINEVRQALEGLLEPELKEEVTGTVEVRQIFRIPKVGAVAGCYVVSGKITRNDRVKIYRDDKLIYQGRISSLKRFKDDVREVPAGYECGVGLDGFDDIKVNDVIETYQVVEMKRTLE